MSEAVVGSVMTRRELIIAISASALAIASGCATFQRESEMESALAELVRLLSQIDDGSDSQLMVTAENIGESAHELLDKHERFDVEFNELAIDHTVSDESLRELVAEYEARRVSLRNDLLVAEQGLVAELPDNARSDVLEILNRKGRMLVSQRGREV